MQRELIDHSPDLKRLDEEGHEVEIKDGFLLVHHIPYVNSQRQIKYGTLVSELTLTSNYNTEKPSDHVIHWIGENPCNKDGSVISGIQHNTNTRLLTNTIQINFSFSNKPEGGYNDYYEKVFRYIQIISAPAKSLNPNVTERTFAVVAPEEEDSVFHYIDTNSSRASINLISDKLKEQRIGIIGLGGTGSYILDFVSKTPVHEIHLFDGDYFLQHNAFRAPGAASTDQLRKRLKKTEYLQQVYSNMRKNIISHSEYIDAANVHELESMDFVFVCVDKGPIKKVIFEYLHERNIPFIDVGMGIENVENSLIGILRVTYISPEKRDHVKNRITFADDENEEYSSNIQIADLNALNATLAVIKWKKAFGFYQDLDPEHNTTYTINTSQLINDDYST